MTCLSFQSRVPATSRSLSASGRSCDAFKPPYICWDNPAYVPRSVPTAAAPWLGSDACNKCPARPSPPVLPAPFPHSPTALPLCAKPTGADACDAQPPLPPPPSPALGTTSRNNLQQSGLYAVAGRVAGCGRAGRVKNHPRPFPSLLPLTCCGAGDWMWVIGRAGRVDGLRLAVASSSPRLPPFPLLPLTRCEAGDWSCWPRG